MLTLIAAGLMLGGMEAGDPAPEPVHRIRIEHASGPVEIDYRPTLSVHARQLGTVAPGGRAGTLRCVWTAEVTVERSAHHASGAVLERVLRRDGVARASHPGWCKAAQGRALESAGRADLGTHRAALARQDHPSLVAALDRLRTRSTE